MLEKNLGVSENSNYSMRLLLNVLFSTPNVIIRELLMNSVENQITSEMTVFHQPSDLSRSHLKEELLFSKILSLVVKRLHTKRVLNVLSHIISN